MGDYVEKYKCGSCRYFEYAGRYEKGYCSWYRTYYHADEECNHWEQKENMESSGGCFFTSACCTYKGLPDDCEELTIMRNFRDTKLQKTEWGKKCIELYYREAPLILQRIERHSQREQIFEKIYSEIRQIVKLVKTEMDQEAVIRYLLMVMEADINSRENTIQK